MLLCYNCLPNILTWIKLKAVVSVIRTSVGLTYVYLVITLLYSSLKFSQKQYCCCILDNNIVTLLLFIARLMYIETPSFSRCCLIHPVSLFVSAACTIYPVANTHRDAVHLHAFTAYIAYVKIHHHQRASKEWKESHSGWLQSDRHIYMCFKRTDLVRRTQWTVFSNIM